MSILIAEAAPDIATELDQLAGFATLATGAQYSRVLRSLP